MSNAIDVQDVEIRYRSFKKMSVKKTLFSIKKNETEYYDAIRGVSFSVEEGQIVGIIVADYYYFDYGDLKNRAEACKA